MKGFEDIDWGIFDNSPPNLTLSSAADVAAPLPFPSHPSSSSFSSSPAKGSLALSRSPPHHHLRLTHRQLSSSPAPPCFKTVLGVKERLHSTFLIATTTAATAEMAAAPTSWEKAKTKDKNKENDDEREEEEEEEKEQKVEKEVAEEIKEEKICQGKQAATTSTSYLPPTPTTATRPRKGNGTGPIIQTSMPLLFPSAVQRQKDGLGLLVSMSDKAFECEGDTGALGRCTLIQRGREGGQWKGREGGQQHLETLLLLDLKGVEYVGRVGRLGGTAWLVDVASKARAKKGGGGMREGRGEGGTGEARVESVYENIVNLLSINSSLDKIGGVRLRRREDEDGEEWNVSSEGSDSDLKEKGEKGNKMSGRNGWKTTTMAASGSRRKRKGNVVAWKRKGGGFGGGRGREGGRKRMKTTATATRKKKRVSAKRKKADG